MRCSLRRYFEPVVSIHEAIQFQSAFALASERYMPHIVVEGGTYLFQSAFALASERCCLYRQFNRIADVSIRVRSRERTIETICDCRQGGKSFNPRSLSRANDSHLQSPRWCCVCVSIRVRSRERTIHGTVL